MVAYSNQISKKVKCDKLAIAVISEMCGGFENIYPFLLSSPFLKKEMMLEPETNCCLRNFLIQPDQTLIHSTVLCRLNSTPLFLRYFSVNFLLFSNDTKQL